MIEYHKQSCSIFVSFIAESRLAPSLVRSLFRSPGGRRDLEQVYAESHQVKVEYQKEMPFTIELDNTGTPPTPSNDSAETIPRLGRRKTRQENLFPGCFPAKFESKNVPCHDSVVSTWKHLLPCEKLYKFHHDYNLKISFLRQYILIPIENL